MRRRANWPKNKYYFAFTPIPTLSPLIFPCDVVEWDEEKGGGKSNDDLNFIIPPNHHHHRSSHYQNASVAVISFIRYIPPHFESFIHFSPHSCLFSLFGSLYLSSCATSPSSLTITPSSKHGAHNLLIS